MQCSRVVQWYFRFITQLKKELSHGLKTQSCCSYECPTFYAVIKEWGASVVPLTAAISTSHSYFEWEQRNIELCNCSVSHLLTAHTRQLPGTVVNGLEIFSLFLI